MKIYYLLFLTSFCTSSPTNPNPFEDKEALINELEHVQLMKELEVLIQSLDDEQLDKLENIINKDLDQASEFDMIVKELKAMGMDDEDIEDLGQLALLMKEFLEKVPMLEEKLGMTSGSNELLDNIQLYLLGLPNKLGPLGYIALHHVLDGADEPEDGDIVDVIIEPASVRKIEEMEKLGKPETVTVSSSAVPEQIVDEETIAPLFRRRRSLSGAVQRVNGVAQQVKP